MGVDGTNYNIKFLDIKDGEDVTISTPDDKMIFVMNAGGVLTFCNETNNYHQEGAKSIARPTNEGTWIVESCKTFDEAMKELEDEVELG